jgi:hypothetical protein
MQGFIADLDKQIEELERERAKCRLHKDIEKINARLMQLRVLKAQAESTLP